MVQFLVESGLISMLGGGFGIVLGASASLSLGATTGWNIVVSPDSIALAVAFSASIGILFGLWPARTASALHPIQALRSE
jgi:ABC-type antimicrobial peptide transport system permease subunit